jgi:surfactin synthase thioesterase subunit
MGVELPATLMFDYPTISAAAGMISEEVGSFTDGAVDEAVSSSRSFDNRRELYSGDAKVVIFCLAYAGGVASSIFSSWATSLPGDVSVAPLDLPGRGVRNHEDSLCDITSIAHMFSDLISQCEVPYYIFAHSTGAILMHEILMEMKRNGRDRNLVGAYASACPAPCYFMRFSKALFEKSMKQNSSEAKSAGLPSSSGSTPSQSDLIGMLQLSRQMTGIQSDSMLDMLEGSGVFCGIEKMRSSSSLYSQVMPLIIDDIEMIVRYSYKPYELLETPIVCFRGSLDTTHEPETVRMWKNVTMEDTKTFIVPGDHFFLHQKAAKDMILSTIISDIADKRSNSSRATSGEEFVASEFIARPTVHDIVAVVIPSGMNSDSMCSIQEILDGFAARAYIVESGAGTSTLNSLSFAPQLIVTSIAGVQDAILLSDHYNATQIGHTTIAVFDCETVADVSGMDRELLSQDIIHFVSYSERSSIIRTTGTYLSVSLPCSRKEILDLRDDWKNIFISALSGFISNFRS